MPSYCYFKGEIIPLENAKISVMTHALHYGTGKEAEAGQGHGI
ncbi:branched-chain amino acid aminotransferase FtsH [Dehalogenimonas sp. WBC-2]|nr:branched-chain amino acid aminotransferase FtsH [Dehalogenimonas sp. WBC-2]